MEDCNIDIDSALDILFKLDEQQPGKKQLINKGRTVYLQIGLFKIPFGPERKKKYLKLRHSLYGDDPEICLFVPNRQTGVKYKKTTDELIDFSINYYTEFLEKHKIKNISTIMPVKQLKAEYGTFELKRSLTRRFDLFLCKTSLLYNPRFLNSLGKIFRNAKKEPIGVPFPNKDADFDPNFRKNIKKATLLTSFIISRYSDNYTVPFGNLNNTRDQLKENLELVLKQLRKENVIPGGFRNVRVIYLWPSQLKPIPLYFSKELPVGMNAPAVRCKRSKRMGVEGELSTQPGKKVFVMPDGEVFVTKMSKNEDEPEIDLESEESFEDESGDDVKEENEEEERRNKRRKKNFTKFKNATKIKKESESESEDDEEIERKEAELLKMYS